MIEAWTEGIKFEHCDGEFYNLNSGIVRGRYRDVVVFQNKLQNLKLYAEGSPRFNGAIPKFVIFVHIMHHLSYNTEAGAIGWLGGYTTLVHTAGVLLKTFSRLSYRWVSVVAPKPFCCCTSPWPYSRMHVRPRMGKERLSREISWCGENICFSEFSGKCRGGPGQVGPLRK